MEFRQLHTDEVLSIHLGPGLYLAVWRDAPSRVHLETLSREAKVLRREFPDGLVFVNAVVGGTPKFDESITQQTVRANRRNAGWAVASAHIVLARGFVGVATRAFLSTVNLMSKGGPPTSVHTECESAAAWILPFLPTVRSADEKSGQKQTQNDAALVNDLTRALETACSQPFE